MNKEYMNPIDRFVIFMIMFGFGVVAMILFALHTRDAEHMQQISYTPFEIQAAYSHVNH